MKKISVALAALILLAVMLSSCRAPICATLLTGGEGGTYYSIGNALSDLLGSNEDENGEKDKTKYTATFDVLSSSGYAENIDKLSDGNAGLAIVRNDIAYYALNGKGIYEDNAQKGFSLICELYNEAVHILAHTGTGSMSSLNGKVISLGEEGSASEIIAKAVLEASGVNDYVAVNLSAEKSITAFKNREIDAFIFISGITSSIVTNLANEFTFEMLGLEDAAVESLCEEYEFFKPCTIQKRNYSVLKNTINTVTLRACLLANDKLDKDLIYNITKRFAEDAALLEHAKYTELSPKTMWEGTCLPIHSGAEKYIKEYEKELAEKEANKSTKVPETTASPDIGENDPYESDDGGDWLE